MHPNQLLQRSFWYAAKVEWNSRSQVVYTYGLRVLALRVPKQKKQQFRFKSE